MRLLLDRRMRYGGRVGHRGLLLLLRLLQRLRLGLLSGLLGGLLLRLLGLNLRLLE